MNKHLKQNIEKTAQVHYFVFLFLTYFHFLHLFTFSFCFCVISVSAFLKVINIFLLIDIFIARRVCIARTMPSHDVCPSICLSHTGIVFKRLYISSKFSSPSVRPTILVFPHQTAWQYSDLDPHNGSSSARGYEKLWFSTNISFYLANDARQSHSYYGRRIGNRTKACEWYQFEISWMTSNPDFKVTILFNVK